LFLVALAWLAIPAAIASAQSATPVAPPTTTMSVRVMTFNIWLGGDQVDFEKVADVVRTGNADVVGVQEAQGQIPRLADELGWDYYDERLQIISRYPLIDPPGGNGVYLFVEPLPGQIFAIGNVHLPSTPYGPEAVRDGSTPEEVMTIEQETRLPAIQDQLRELPALVEQGIPTILTGDFNAPSFQDWTEETVASRDQVKYPFNWPVSEALAATGFHDSYRDIHPDPATKPGLTWTPGYPNPLLREAETFDRIDQIWLGGEIEAASSEIVGEQGGADVDYAVTPYPSDHRAVVSELSIFLATPIPR
jgi:endonuclease/exonuclease/phosphatase family metal-dependent hydrolase